MDKDIFQKENDCYRKPCQRARYELKKLVEATENLRIELSYLGTTIEPSDQTISLKILNVAFDKYSAVVRVDDKTGSRRVRLKIFTSAFAQ